MSENEVLECFVHAELASPRYGERVAALMEEYSDSAAILGKYRAWGRNEGLFDGFPSDVRWYRASLSTEEVLNILYIKWDWWLRITNGSRRPRDAAERVRAGLVAGVSADEGDEQIARAAPANPPLIAVSAPDGPLVLVEGHVRLTAYALFPEHLPAELEIYLGESPRMAEWSEY